MKVLTINTTLLVIYIDKVLFLHVDTLQFVVFYYRSGIDMLHIHNYTVEGHIHFHTLADPIHLWVKHKFVQCHERLTSINTLKNNTFITAFWETIY